MTTAQTIVGHYAQLLGLTHPWIVKEVKVDVNGLKVDILVAWEQGNKAPCPLCNKYCSIEDHREVRSWRHLDTMQFETVITCRIPRISCFEHGIKSIKAPWAGENSRFTLLFEHFAIDVILAAKSITQAMGLLRLSWDQIHLIQLKAVDRGLGRRKNEPIDYAGIDEKNFGKGHSYVSVLTDLDRSRVLEVVPDRSLESAESLWQKLPEKQRKGIRAVAMDMWEAFMTASKNNAPQADIVHDKFHTVAYLTKAVDNVRRKENKNMLKIGDETLKGSKYLWLTNPDNFKPEEKSAFRHFALDELKVGKAWSIKEAFQHFWDYSYQGSAQSFFKRWYFWATHCHLKPMIEAAKTLKRHLVGLLAYLKHHITNAVTEGLNSKIQIIKSNARGFRNFNNYRAAILFHCGKLSLYP
jgi:transposase